MRPFSFLLLVLASSSLVLAGCEVEVDESDEDVGECDDTFYDCAILAEHEDEEDEEEPSDPPPPKECDPAQRPTHCLHDVTECRDGVWGCGNTPLVLSFDGREPTFTEATVSFDLTGQGISMMSDWPRAETPWLALDRNADGRIADATELFGSAVTLTNGARAANGFEALAELDSDESGAVDAADARFGELAIWADTNADRATDAGELVQASSAVRRVVSIELAYQSVSVCDAHGNCGVERARFTWADASGALHTGTVIDVHLPTR